MELDDAFNTIAKHINKAEIDANSPYSDAIQWYKEKADISYLEEQAWSKRPKRKTGVEELGEERSLTFIQLLRSITPKDTELMGDAFIKCTKHGEKGEAADVERWDFQYSDVAYKQYQEQLNITDSVNDSYMMDWKRCAFKVVTVGKNMIPSHFVPIHREFAGKYGDFSAGSELSPIAKALFFHLFFTVVYSMRGTMVLEITDEILCTWRFHLRVVQIAGFDIQFALDNLENLVRACFGLKVLKFRDETTENLEKQIEEILRRVQQNESKLGLLRAIRERYRKPKEGAGEESLVKQCLVEAAKCKWMDLGALIL